MSIEKGTVKWFSEIKGYGFIATDSGEDVFVHSRQIQSTQNVLKDGDRVEFEVSRSEKGLSANYVRVI